jgi:membrane-associated phospholipid phosphatase
VPSRLICRARPPAHAANMAGAIVAFALATLAAAPAAAANSVTDWHARAQHAIVDVAQELPWNQTRSLAMVSAAAYDAVNAIDGTPYRPYLVAPAAHRSYSKDAAVATAAHDVLMGLLPAQRSSLDQQYDEALAAIPNGPDKAGGVAVGGQTADAMLAARENDGVDASQTWIVGTQPGQWRPTPPFMVGISAQIGFMRTFAIPDPDLFRSPRPNALTSAKYATDFNEVKSIGAASSTTRTSDQSQAAIFWSDLRNPWWSIFDQIALARHLSVSETARMLALLYISQHDSFIANFKAKHHWSSWRPVTAIPEAGADGNPQTAADSDWTPLLPTPPVPEHPSGHAMVSATITTILALFFRTDRMAFTGYSPDTNTTRRYARFSDALTEIINARVWGGIHFRTADNQGAVQGAKLAAYVWLTRVQPTR